MHEKFQYQGVEILLPLDAGIFLVLLYILSDNIPRTNIFTFERKMTGFSTYIQREIQNRMTANIDQPCRPEQRRVCAEVSLPRPWW